MENQGWANWPQAATAANSEPSETEENRAEPGWGAPPAKKRAAYGTGSRLRLDSVPAVRRFITGVIRDLKAGVISADKARALIYGAKEVAALFMAEQEAEIERRLEALEAGSR